MSHVTHNNLLNDDCMLEIFKYLNVTDLCQTTQVSLQFDRLSQYTFKQKYAHFELRKHFRNRISKNKIYTLFDRSARYMITLDLDASISLNSAPHIHEVVVNLIKKHFLHEENILKNLRLRNFHLLDPNDMLDFYGIFIKLESLQLEQTPIPEAISDFIENFTKIKHMRLIKCTPSYWPPNMFFKQQSHFMPFISKMQTLDMKYNEYLHPLLLLNGIENYFPYLRELTLYSSVYNENYPDKSTFSVNIKNIARLPMLLKLDIDLKFNCINPLLNGMKQHSSPIQNLNVYHATFNGDSKQCLNGLKNIKKLRLYGMCEISTPDIVNMGIYLENLEEFSINFSSNLNMLKNIIQNAQKLTKLRIPIHSNHTITQAFYSALLATVKRRNKDAKLTVKIYNFDRIHRNEEEQAMLAQNNVNKSLHIYRMP